MTKIRALGVYWDYGELLLHQGLECHLTKIKKDKHDLNTHTNTVECAQRLFNVEVLYRCLVVVVFSLFNMKETPR